MNLLARIPVLMPMASQLAQNFFEKLMENDRQ